MSLIPSLPHLPSWKKTGVIAIGSDNLIAPTQVFFLSQSFLSVRNSLCKPLFPGFCFHQLSWKIILCPALPLMTQLSTSKGPDLPFLFFSISYFLLFLFVHSPEVRNQIPSLPPRTPCVSAKFLCSCRSFHLHKFIHCISST